MRFASFQFSVFSFQFLGFRVQGSGFRVQGSGFRVQGSGFRVQERGYRGRGGRQGKVSLRFEIPTHDDVGQPTPHSILHDCQYANQLLIPSLAIHSSHKPIYLPSLAISRASQLHLSSLAIASIQTNSSANPSPFSVPKPTRRCSGLSGLGAQSLATQAGF